VPKRSGHAFELAPLDARNRSIGGARVPGNSVNVNHRNAAQKSRASQGSLSSEAIMSSRHGTEALRNHTKKRAGRENGTKPGRLSRQTHQVEGRTQLARVTHT